MENEVKLTQEKWNMVLDLKDKVNRQEDELNRLRRMYRALEEKNNKLEVELLKYKTNVNFNDIFKKGNL